MTLNLPLKDFCPKRVIIYAWKQSDAGVLESNMVEHYLNRLHSHSHLDLCLTFTGAKIQQVLRLYGYINLDNLYFHEKAHKEVSNSWYLWEDQMLKISNF